MMSNKFVWRWLARTIPDLFCSWSTFFLFSSDIFSDPYFVLIRFFNPLYALQPRTKFKFLSDNKFFFWGGEG